ncbi:predicted protein [Nematostella vectensis]|uniref:Uncharacterized protein n=1 Tax=Nematostella vectensis TaxID=45351 RepID=A7RXP0_NEMVE|nr:predicted protein [Nematostella vectensis]|eukprot:XP_001635873.1 predicted protein [Nematostella vectensis]
MPMLEPGRLSSHVTLSFKPINFTSGIYTQYLQKFVKRLRTSHALHQSVKTQEFPCFQHESHTTYRGEVRANSIPFYQYQSCRTRIHKKKRIQS